MADVNITIIGAGVVGLAIAKELSDGGYKDILVVDKYSKFGQETSSRNSEVIHAGIYYKPGSLTSRMCRVGSSLLYKYCQDKNIKHKRNGKYIVANSSEEVAILDGLHKNAKLNMCETEFVDSYKLKSIEPNVKCLTSLYSPNTGIVDSHSLMKNLENDAKMNGVSFAYNTEIISITHNNDMFILSDGDTEITTNILINSAGLNAHNIAKMFNIDYNVRYVKGEYFSYPKNLFNSLIYPVPEKGLKGLGIHSVADLNDNMRFGVNAFYVDEINYDVNPEHLDEFYTTVSKFTTVDKSLLKPDFSGIRPQVVLESGEKPDFIIKSEKNKGYPNLINLVGICSPGLTSCLAIGDYVKSILQSQLKVNT